MADKSWAFCDQHPDVTKVLFHWVVAPFQAAESLIILSLLVVFIINKKNGAIQTTTPLFFGALLMFICCLGATIPFAAVHEAMCRDGYFRFYQIGYLVAGEFYPAAYMALIATLYGRLYLIFKGTPMQLSLAVNITFLSINVLLVILGVPATFLYVFHHSKQITVVMTVVVVVSFIVVLVWLMCVLVRKLFVFMQKMSERNGASVKELKPVITKASLLAIISLTSSSLSFAVTVLNLLVDNVYVYAATCLLYSTDLLINTVCVLLMFDKFSKYYGLCCGKCDRQWDLVWAATNVELTERTTNESSRGRVRSVELDTAVVVSTAEMSPAAEV